MKAIIIDDEFYAIEALKYELMQIGGVEIRGTYESGKTAIESADWNDVELVFLDIEMQGTSGIECFGRLMEINRNLNIVFVTAYENYAIKAFELNAMDYILKPVTQKRLRKTLERLSSVEEDYEAQKPYIQCFKNFSIYMNNKVLDIEWRTKKAEELIAYLMNESGHYVTKEKLADVLWPELSADRGLSNLYLSLHYIRKQEKKYGMDLHIDSKRGKMRIDFDQIDSDVKKMDDYYNTFKTTGELTDRDRVLIKELYKGNLFEDKYYDWVTLNIMSPRI